MSRPASVSAVDPFGEHVSVMKALYQEFQKRDDLEALAAVNTVVNNIQSTCSRRDNAVKDLIRGLTCEVESLQASSRYPQQEGTHERRVAAMEADIRDVQASCQQLDTSTRDVETHRTQLTERTKSAAARTQQAKSQLAAEEDALRHQVSLYAHISRITWQLDRADRIMGTVADAQQAQIRTIDIDPTSTFEAVNQLWQLL